MLHYLDNSATTRLLPEVADAVCRTLKETFGNPSSLHPPGVSARALIDEAREKIASALCVNAEEIVFTSGGTESNNTAIFGVARLYAKRGRHIVTSAIEHPSVLEPLSRLAAEGFEVEHVPPLQDGSVPADEVLTRVRKDTVLVTMMHVNNEVGSVLPIDAVGRGLREFSPRPVFHVDAVQSFGKYRIEPEGFGIDLLSASGHKIHGPKGTGFLYVRRGLEIPPYMLGGGQERGFRSGTENVHGIVGMAEAISALEKANFWGRVKPLRCRIEEGAMRIPGCSVIGPKEEGLYAPHILSLRVEGVRGEVLVRFLGAEGVCVSSGSACHGHRGGPSPVLAALGMKSKEAEQVIRVSLSVDNDESDADAFLSSLEKAVSHFRRVFRS
ncbi:MAG: cysteine desulfurase family protein [Bacillota bacterium]